MRLWILKFCKLLEHKDVNIVLFVLQLLKVRIVNI